MEKVWREELYKIINSYPPESSQVLISKAIIKHLNHYEGLNVQQIAKETFSSKPTVTRFAKSFGFDGIKDFYKAIHKQDQTYYYKRETKDYFQSYQDYNLDLSRLVNDFSSQFEILAKIVKLIKDKQKIFIFSTSETINLANEFSDKLNFLGIKSYAATINQIFLMNSINQDDVVLFFASALDTDILLKMWKKLEGKSYRILIATHYQTLKFDNATYIIEINVTGNLLRPDLKKFMFEYSVNQIYNLLVHSDLKFIDKVDQDITITIN